MDSRTVRDPTLGYNAVRIGMLSIRLERVIVVSCSCTLEARRGSRVSVKYHLVYRDGIGVRTGEGAPSNEVLRVFGCTNEGRPGPYGINEDASEA